MTSWHFHKVVLLTLNSDRVPNPFTFKFPELIMRVNPKLCVRLWITRKFRQFNRLVDCVRWTGWSWTQIRKLLDKDYLINTLAYVGLLSVVLTFPVCFSVTCKQSYDPNRYIGKARVPVDCKTESLGCPPSWKALEYQKPAAIPPMPSTKWSIPNFYMSRRFYDQWLCSHQWDKWTGSRPHWRHDWSRNWSR